MLKNSRRKKKKFLLAFSLICNTNDLWNRICMWFTLEKESVNIPTLIFINYLECNYALGILTTVFSVNLFLFLSLGSLNDRSLTLI